MSVASLRGVADHGLLAGVLAVGVASPVSAQVASQAAWAGWAQCVINTQGPGYGNQQTQTWTTTGGTPTAQGAFRMHPATWSVAGSGSLQRTQGNQSLEAQWTTNVGGVSAPISVVVRASDGRLLIRAGHAQLRQAGAIVGTQTQKVSGTPTSVTAISAEAFEWGFPAIEDSAGAIRTQGSSSGNVAGSFGVMQPAGSTTSATCSWDFARGAAPSPVPQVVAVAGGPAPTTTSPPRTPPSQPPYQPPASTPPAPAAGAPVATAPSSSPPATIATTVPTTVAQTTPPPASSPPAGGATTSAPPTLTTAPGSTSGATLGGGSPTGLSSAAPPAPTPVNPTSFVAKQVREDGVELTWNAAPGAAYYMLWGAGLPNTGVRVDSTRQVVGGVPAGSQTWTVGSYYLPGPVTTSASAFTKATLTVNAVCSGPGTPPGQAPSDVDTVAGRLYTAAVTWRLVPNAIAYIVDRATVMPGGTPGPWGLVASNCAGATSKIVIAGATPIAPVAANHAGAIDNVQFGPGTQVVYRVRAYDAAGRMGWNSIRWTAPPRPAVRVDSMRASGSTLILGVGVPPSLAGVRLPDYFSIQTSYGTRVSQQAFGTTALRPVSFSSVPLGPQTYTVTLLWEGEWLGQKTSVGSATTTKTFTLTP